MATTRAARRAEESASTFRVDELYAAGTRQGELAGILGLSGGTVSIRRRRSR